MKALVTGASGFIGSTLIDLLGQDGFEVYAMMRKTSSDQNLKGLRYTRVEGSLGDAESLKKAVQGMDVVFHLAGVIMAKNHEEFLEHNTHGTRRLAEAAANSSVKRFVYVSSVAASGPTESREAQDETCADRPVSSYGISKLGGETELLKFKDRFEVVIVRPPIVYGPKDSATFILVKTVNGRILPKLSSRSPDGEKYHSVIHAEDLVKGILAAGRVDSSKITSGEKFFLTSGETITLSQLMLEISKNVGVRTFALPIPFFILTPVAAFLTLLGKLLGRPFILSLDKLNEMRPDYWVYSNEKARKKLDFKPRYGLPEGMSQAIRWYRENKWLK